MKFRSVNSLLWIFLKSVFTLKNIILFMFIIVTVSLLSVTMFPLEAFYNLFILLITIVVGGVTFNSLSNVKTSTLFYEFKANWKFEIFFYINVFLVMFLITFLSLTFFIGFLSVYNAFNILLMHWPWENNLSTRGHFNLWNISIVLTNAYWAFITILLFFSLSFMTRNLLKTQKSYMAFVFGLVIFSITFGGSINNMFAHAYQTEGSDFYYVGYKGNDKLFYTCLIFPFFAPGQMMSISYFGYFHYLGTGNVELFDMWHWYTPIETFAYVDNDLNPLWHWNLLYILPIIEIFSFILIGLKLK